ncbi:MAG: alpha/beta hydrolase [Sphingobacteriaceae bacterium]
MFGSWTKREMTMVQHLFYLNSAALNREVTCTILLPENYDPALSLNLLLLNDGQNLEDLRVKQQMESLLADNYIGQTMVAGIHAGDRLQEYGTAWQADYKNRGNKASAYTDFIVNELLPALTSYAGIMNFNIKAFAGCALGAVSAFDIAWNHAEIFDHVGAFSGAFWWRSKDLAQGYREEEDRIVHQLIKKTIGKPKLKFWFQAGTLDEDCDRNHNGIVDSVDDTTDMIRLLEEKGYSRPGDIRYLESVGGKTEFATWSLALPKFLTWAF